MAKWSKNKVAPSQINKGNEYTKDDNVSVEELNAIVNNSFNSQDQAEQSLETVKGFRIGSVISGDIPSASILVDPNKKEIILNLILPKGDKGDKGDTGEAGSAGTMDYNDLSNKPQINGSELIGNKTSAEIGLEFLTNNELETLLK
jgi:hypothetical protein